MNENAQFIPFNAINEFMLTDFRRGVIQETFLNLKQVSEDKQKTINGLVRRLVKVQGFRNSTQAPLPLKINGAINAFEKSSEFVKQLLQVWCEIHPQIRHNTFELLTNRKWTILPEDTDRTVLPGFLVRWPAAESFEVLVKAYRETYPDDEASDDVISLMFVWLSGRLPVEMVESDLFEDLENDKE